MSTPKKKPAPVPIPEGWHETEIQTWPGLFRCLKFNGQCVAELAPELFYHSQHILNQPSPVVGTPRFKKARNAAHSMCCGDKDWWPAGVADLFKWVSDSLPVSRQERENRAKEAKDILCAIVDELADLQQVTPHASKITVRMDGHEQPVPLAYAAIEHARQFVGLHQRLPTKIELQRNLEDAYPKPVWNPKTGEWKEKTGTWTEVWKEAGLDSLEDGKYGTGNVPLGSR